MSKLLRFFKDKAGNLSSMRLMMVGIIALVMSVWAYLSITSQALVEIPAGVVSVVLAAITGKVVQTSFGEPQETQSEVPPQEDAVG